MIKYIITIAILLTSCSGVHENKTPNKVQNITNISYGENKIDEFVFYRTHPRYPIEAKRNSIEGSVTLEYQIINNRIENIKVVNSTPKGVFDRSAIESLNKTTIQHKISSNIYLNIESMKKTYEFKSMK